MAANDLKTKEYIENSQSNQCTKPKYYEEMFMAVVNGNIQNISEIKKVHGVSALNMTTAKNNMTMLTFALNTLKLTSFDKLASQKLTMTIKYLINQGADVNKIGSDGRTPLFVAIQQNNLPIVQFLLSNNANLEILDPHGCSILFTAIYTDNDKLLRLLLNQNPNLQVVNSDGDSLLAAAMRYCKKLAIPELLIKQGLDVSELIKVENDILISPLECAVMTKESNSLPKIDLLARSYVNLDMIIDLKYNITALHSAIASQKFEQAERLVERGASFNIQARTGEFAYAMAICACQFRLVKIMADTSDTSDTPTLNNMFNYASEHLEIAKSNASSNTFFFNSNPNNVVKNYKRIVDYLGQKLASESEPSNFNMGSIN